MASDTVTHRDLDAVQRQTTWFTQRRALETSRRKVSPDGPVGHRWWRGLELLFSLFERLLRLSGLYNRGRADALDITVKPLTLTLPSLPNAFDGYRILQISDPHLDLLPELADRIVPLVRAASSDLLLLTGDYRDRH